VRDLIYFASFRCANPRAWLLQIVRNTAYSALRRDRGVQIAPVSRQTGGRESKACSMTELADSRDNPESALIRDRDRRLIDQLIASLAIDLREGHCHNNAGSPASWQEHAGPTGREGYIGGSSRNPCEGKLCDPFAAIVNLTMWTMFRRTPKIVPPRSSRSGLESVSKAPRGTGRTAAVYGRRRSANQRCGCPRPSEDGR
jgi:hypothetical protein